MQCLHKEYKECLEGARKTMGVSEWVREQEGREKKREGRWDQKVPIPYAFGVPSKILNFVNVSPTQ